MKLKDILSNLCDYDPRNPLYDKENWRTLEQKDCMCDNCFYGRTGMAEELLIMRYRDGTLMEFKNPGRENNKREQEAYGNLLAHTNDAEEVLEQIMDGKIPHIMFCKVEENDG